MSKNSFMLGSIIVSLILIQISLIFAITGSMGNAKMILRPELDDSEVTILKYIKVKNVNDILINVVLETNEEGSEFIEIIDDSIELEPGEEYKAKFLVKIEKPGTYEGRINVFFTPAEKEGPGVALSSTIIVIASGEEDGDNDEEKEDDKEDKEEDKKDDKEDKEITTPKEFDSEQPENTETEEVEEENINLITGGSIGIKEQSQEELKFLSISTIALLLVLAFLLYQLKGGERGKLNEKIGEKRKL